MLISDHQPPKTRPAARKYALNEDYFSVKGGVTPEQAYWLGYLLADGSVHVRARHTKPQFVLSASSKDYEQLEKLKRALGAGHPIHGPHQGVYQLIVTSYPLCLALEACEIVPNKSYVGRPPDNALIAGDRFYDWLRGLVDGDGSFNIYHRPNRAKKNNGKGRPATTGQDVLMFSVTGTHAVAANLWRRFGGSLSRASGGVAWTWRINDRRARSILQAMYAGSTPETRLDRKFAAAVSLGIVEEDGSASTDT